MYWLTKFYCVYHIFIDINYAFMPAAVVSYKLGVSALSNGVEEEWCHQWGEKYSAYWLYMTPARGWASVYNSWVSLGDVTWLEKLGENQWLVMGHEKYVLLD